MSSAKRSPSSPWKLPRDFVYGYATAAAQTEGGIHADGRRDSIWDVFSRQEGKIEDGSTTDITNDAYHRAEDDVELLRQLGATGYRLSVSWSRIIPLGGRDDQISEKGIQYYIKLLDLLHEAKIAPYITLFHWDLPQSLQDRYDGWRNRKEIVADFTRFADVVFQRLGDKCRNWITLNEPYAVVVFGRAGLVPNWQAGRDMYTIASSLVLAHASAVELYRNKYQRTHGGKIGVTMCLDWVEPLDLSTEAQKAAQKRRDAILGLYTDPIYLGHFPESIVNAAGSALEPYSGEEWSMIKGSSDFFGLNSYSTFLTTGRSDTDETTGFVEVTQERNGQPIGKASEIEAFKSVPWGFGKLLDYIQHRYLGELKVPLIITEQGIAVKDESKKSREEALDDQERIEFYENHLREVVLAVERGIDIRGYFAWTLSDNWEWTAGFVPRFGVAAIDRDGSLNRLPKASSRWLKDYFSDSISK